MKLTEKLAWLSSQWGRRDLSMRAKHVLFALVERSDCNLTCYPSIETIGRTVIPGVFMSTSRKEMPS